MSTHNIDVCYNTLVILLWLASAKTQHGTLNIKKLFRIEMFYRANIFASIQLQHSAYARRLVRAA